MRELSLSEIACVGGGGKEPESGTLSRPTRGESEPGKITNDFFGMATSLGNWLGCGLYDLLHPVNKK